MDKIREQQLDYNSQRFDITPCTSSVALDFPFHFSTNEFDDKLIWWDGPDTRNNVFDGSDLENFDGGLQNDWGCLLQGDLWTSNGDFSLLQTPFSENHIHSSILDPAQDAVPGADAQGLDRALSPKRSSVQAPEPSEPLINHPSKPLGSDHPVTSWVDDSYTSVHDPTSQNLAPSKDYKPIIPELESCRLCPYKGSAHGIAHVVIPLLVGDAEQLTTPTEDISRRTTMTDHLLLSFHASDRVSPAASRCSKTKEAEHATGSNPVRLSPRNSFNAVAAGESGVGQTLLRATELVSRELGVSTYVIVRHTLRTSSYWRTTTTRITWAREVDLRQRIKWRDDWAVWRASGILDDQRQGGWMLSNRMMMTDDNTYSRSRPRAS